MKKVAVIIKHPYRNSDYRVDIFEVPEGTDYQDIHNYVMYRMLGPFEIIAITAKVSLDGKITEENLIPKV